MHIGVVGALCGCPYCSIYFSLECTIKTSVDQSGLQA